MRSVVVHPILHVKLTCSHSCTFGSLASFCPHENYQVYLIDCAYCAVRHLASPRTNRLLQGRERYGHGSSEFISDYLSTIMPRNSRSGLVVDTNHPHTVLPGACAHLGTGFCELTESVDRRNRQKQAPCSTPSDRFQLKRDRDYGLRNSA